MMSYLGYGVVVVVVVVRSLIDGLAVTTRGEAARQSGRGAEFCLEMQETLATSAPGNGVAHDEPRCQRRAGGRSSSKKGGYASALIES